MSYLLIPQKNYLQIFYQNKTSRVKAAEEPEQNSAKTCLFCTCASKASSQLCLLQDHTELSCTYREICLVALAGPPSFSATALNAAYGRACPWLSWGTLTAWPPLFRGGAQPGCEAKYPVTFCYTEKRFVMVSFLTFSKLFLFLQTHVHWYFLLHFRTRDTSSSQPLGLQSKSEDYGSHFKCSVL